MGNNMNKTDRIVLISMNWTKNADYTYYLVIEVNKNDEPIYYYMTRRRFKYIEHCERFQYYNEIFN